MVARELGVAVKTREMERVWRAQDMTLDMSSDDESDSQPPMALVLYLRINRLTLADGIEDDNWEE